MRRVQVGPITKMISRAKLRDWSQQRGNQAGMSAAGQVLSEGAMDDPYKAIAQSIGTFFAARNQDRYRADQEKLKMDELAIERARQAKLDARADEEYSLRKRSLEGELSAAEEKRLMAEQQRAQMVKLLPTLSPEDQALLGPLASDPERFYSVYDQIGDNRRSAEEFKTKQAETERYNKSQEGFEERRLRLEAQRIKEAREARAAELARKPENQNKVIERDGQLVTYSPDGEVIKTTPIPRSAKEREDAIIKLVAEGIPLDKAVSAVDQLSKMGPSQAAPAPQAGPAPAAQPGPALASQPAPQLGPVTPTSAAPVDDQIRSLINDARAKGISDEEIMQAVADQPPAYRARLMLLMKLPPKQRQ